MGFFLDALEDELLSITQSSMPKAEESNEAAPTQDEGWLEVGKKNRQVVTRTVRFCPRVPTTFIQLTRLFHSQVKSSESPITRIFGGKFRSTLKAPHQRDSVTVEDWRSLRLDIQVSCITFRKLRSATLTIVYSASRSIQSRMPWPSSRILIQSRLQFLLALVLSSKPVDKSSSRPCHRFSSCTSSASSTTPTSETSSRSASR